MPQTSCHILSLEQKNLIDNCFSQALHSFRENSAPLGVRINGDQSILDFRNTSGVLGFNHPLQLKAWFESSISPQFNNAGRLLDELALFFTELGIKREVSLSPQAGEIEDISLEASRSLNFFPPELLSRINSSQHVFKLATWLPLPIYFANQRQMSSDLTNYQVLLAIKMLRYFKEA